LKGNIKAKKDIFNRMRIQDGGKIFSAVEHSYIDHVGIIYRIDSLAQGEVIHTTNATRPPPDPQFPNVWPGRSVLHEGFYHRSYWSDPENLWD